MLGVPAPGEFKIETVNPGNWGETVVFRCDYTSPASTVIIPFDLILRDCRELQWRVYAHLRHPEDVSLPKATLVNLRLGDDQHRKPLHMLTDFFGISVYYGALEVRRT